MPSEASSACASPLLMISGCSGKGPLTGDFWLGAFFGSLGPRDLSGCESKSTTFRKFYCARLIFCWGYCYAPLVRWWGDSVRTLRFLDPRLFADFFPKQLFLFPDSKLSIRWSIDLEKAGTKRFPWCTPNLPPKLNKIWLKQTKKTSGALVAFKKKKLKTLYHFSRLYLYFTDFFRIWKIAGQISRLFKEFKTLYEPWGELFRTVTHNNNPGQNSWDTH